MEDWEKFEKQACRYLNESFPDSKEQIEFKWSGKSDSKEPDIKAYKKDNHIFNIEAKLSPSQSGQFVVLLNNDGKFEFSEDCEEHVYNKYSENILRYINTNLDKIDLSNPNFNIPELKDDFYNWIRIHYQSKDSKFIITSTSIADVFYAIVPIHQLKKYFAVDATFRLKRSGTTNLPKSQRKEAINKLKEHTSKSNIEVREVRVENDETLVKFDDPVPKSLKKRFGVPGGSKEVQPYFLSNHDSYGEDDEWAIRKRSLTNNPNVIFELEYTGPKKNIGLDKLKSKLIN